MFTRSPALVEIEAPALESPVLPPRQGFNWVNSSFLLLSPPAALVLGILHYQNVGWSMPCLAIFGVMTFLTGLSITAGYHRLYSHRAYSCSPVVRALFLIFGGAALQGSALDWCSDHRYHHRFEDQESDPYSIKKGFFWAHLGWVLRDRSIKGHANVLEMRQDPAVWFQHRHYHWIGILAGFVLPGAVGALLGDAWGGIVWGGLIRVVVVHHSTFLINSAAHFWGSRPYDPQHTARDNGLIALLSFGEGYHNFHHAFPSDYRNGIRWYQWDPTKWLIRGLSLAGVAQGLRVTPEEKLRARKELNAGLASSRAS